MDLTIIIPVYNVERYIRSCLESVFRQGLDESCFEVIIVSDGNDDHSVQIIQDIALLHSNIHIIEQAHQGVCVARNTGLSYANGDYILFVDSDDLLVDNALNTILQSAIGSDVDFVTADFLEIEDCCFPYDEPFCMLSEEVDVWKGTAKDYFLDLFDGRSFVWRNLYKRQFLEDKSIKFIPNICFEDILFNTECILNAQKCLKISIPLYIYRHRHDSFVHKIDQRKMLDLNYVIAYLWKIENNHKLPKDVKRRLTDFIFDTFSFYLWYMISYIHLFKVRKNIIGDLKSKVPNLFFSRNVKQFVISCMFRFIPNYYILIRRECDMVIKLKKKYIL